MVRDMKQALAKLQSFKAIEGILNGLVLEDFQCVDVIKLLWHKVGICMYDTGMGKTVITAALIKMLKNEVPSRKFIMFVEKSQLIQTPEKIREWGGLKILTVSASRSDFNSKLFSRRAMEADVLMLTHGTLNNEIIMHWLYSNKDMYYGVFVDEAHKLSNYGGASSSFMLRGILRNFEFRVALTATPVTSDLGQLIDLAHLFDWNRFSDVKHLKRAVEQGFDVLSEFDDLFYSRSRERDLGIISNYRPHVVMVEPHQNQKGQRGNGVTKITKGPGAYNQVRKMIEIIKSSQPQKGLVYINQHIVRKWVTPILEEAGISVACINGFTSHKDRDQIMSDFAANKLDIVITSVTTALDLECDYIIFYEFCADIKQMMGRAHRGLNPKTLDLYFIFTRMSGEIDYFLKYIYDRSLTIQTVLKKDYSELIRAGEVLSSLN
jgi:superfamily II DNA or RNA helicase